MENPRMQDIVKWFVNRYAFPREADDAFRYFREMLIAFRPEKEVLTWMVTRYVERSRIPQAYSWAWLRMAADIARIGDLTGISEQLLWRACTDGDLMFAIAIARNTFDRNLTNGEIREAGKNWAQRGVNEVGIPQNLRDLAVQSGSEQLVKDVEDLITEFARRHGVDRELVGRDH